MAVGRFRVVPLTLAQANAFVMGFHRHHKPTRGHRFSIGAEEAGRLVGVAIVGRPVSRYYDPSGVAEVTRLCTDGTKDCCSCLYAACARAAQAMGFRTIQTYTLASEPGTSLRASGWTDLGVTTGGQWDHAGERQLRLDGSTRRTDQPTEAKRRWQRTLNG